MAEIKDIFAGWQITEHLNASCRPGALAHIGGGEAHVSFHGRLPGGMTSLDLQDAGLLQRATELLPDVRR